MNIQSIKQRFGIIGKSPMVDRAIETAIRVAPTELAVLITGESGTGKEIMPQIIHQLSVRKHGPYIAVNCGAIPEGTIDSELFGHEKGSFTGAHDSRKGYFEVASGGTIFLDEVAELPLTTQVRLLRVLETGEFIRVGSSKVVKTDVRIVAATNVNVPEAISSNKFREDLYYRLNTVPIRLPALRERKEDIHLIFRKFAADFAEKYRMPPVKLSDDSVSLLENYPWQGNVRQLKNITEQISVIETKRDITPDILKTYLPNLIHSNLPVLFGKEKSGEQFSERDILYKVLFEMKKDITDLKKIIVELAQHEDNQPDFHGENARILQNIHHDLDSDQGDSRFNTSNDISSSSVNYQDGHHDLRPIIQEPEEVVEESLSLEEKEKEMIKKALEKYRGKRKYAARELGISERTLYRKINEYGLK